MKGKVKEKEEALRLRIEEQLSLKQIQEKTGLSKSTLSIHLRDYPLSKERIKELNKPAQIKGAEANKQKAFIREANNKFEGLLMMGRHPAFRELCFLYWAEGTKYEGNSMFSISNTDRYMIKFVINTLKLIGRDDKIKLTCYCYEHSDEIKIKEYWQDFLGIEVKIYRPKKSKASKNLKPDKQPFGTMRLDVYSKRLFDNIMGGIESIRGTLAF
jgi:transcriptional regulator with XRE-family HTH domain